jgi:hypothetical protein
MVPGVSSFEKEPGGGGTVIVPVEFDGYQELEHMYKNKAAKNRNFKKGTNLKICS